MSMASLQTFQSGGVIEPQAPAARFEIRSWWHAYRERYANNQVTCAVTPKRHYVKAKPPSSGRFKCRRDIGH